MGTDVAGGFGSNLGLSILLIPVLDKHGPCCHSAFPLIQLWTLRAKGHRTFNDFLTLFITYHHSYHSSVEFSIVIGQKVLIKFL